MAGLAGTLRAMNEAEALAALADDLASFEHDPLGFVLWAFPWGEPGPLEAETGPDEWQREELAHIGEQLRQDPHTPIRLSTASGHGIGKSAEVGWLILWANMTKAHTRGVVTANSDTQLRTKTWAELAKWHGLLVDQLKAEFTLTATALYHRKHDRTWRIDAIPNSKGNPAAFAGLHNAGGRILIIFDEASEIPDIIWDTTEGATTDEGTEIIWATYGNPTKNTGRFKENTIGRFRHRWKARQIDSRKVKRTNKGLIQGWIDAWGEDSDFVRVRVRGMFPRVGSMQLIPSDLVAAARLREPGYIPSDPLVVGLDVARYGDDSSVLQPRRGRDAKSIPALQWRNVDTMTLAGEVAMWCEKHQPDALFVDVGGVGAGVYDRLIQLKVSRICKVFPVDFAGAGGLAQMNGTSVRVANKRAAMWTAMREWLTLGAIADDDELEVDLTGVEYGFRGADGTEILLESKQHMKERLQAASPDKGDALALTFAWPIPPRSVATARGGQGPQIKVSGSDYNIFADVE